MPALDHFRRAILVYLTYANPAPPVVFLRFVLPLQEAHHGTMLVGGGGSYKLKFCVSPCSHVPPRLHHSSELVA